MANGFTNLPTSLLGAVNIGGNLTVQGTTRSVGVLSSDASLAVGVTPNIVRVGSFTGYGPGISGNLAIDAATRDNAGVTAMLLALGANGNLRKLRRINAAGNANDESLYESFGLNPVLRNITGTVVQQTVFSSVVRAGLMGANGAMLVRFFYNGAQGATPSTITLQAGATVIDTRSITSTTGSGMLQYIITNQNAANAQKALLLLIQGTTTTAGTIITSAVDFGIDQTIQLLDTPGLAGDNINFGGWEVTLLNSFGPV